MVTLRIVSLKATSDDRVSGPWWKVKAVVLAKVATKLPVMPVLFDSNWRHLSGLCLVDLEFGTTGCIDILLAVTYSIEWYIKDAAGPSRFADGYEHLFRLDLV